MKVANDSKYRLIFSVSVHPNLGPIVEPFVVAYTSLDTLSLTYQKVFSGNASYYTRLSEQELKWIKMLDGTMPENLIKVFSKVKKIRPKEFYSKHLDNKLFQTHVRPFLDEKFAALVQQMPYSYDGFYVADEINPAFLNVEITKDFSKVLFHFRRNENGTNYFVTLMHDNDRFAFMKQGGIMLCTQPAVLVVNKKLYRFYDFVDGAKLAVFLDRKYIHIAPQTEEKYYSGFVKKLMETSPVYAEGFEIINEKHEAKVLLKLNKLSETKYGIRVSLKYGKNIFWFSEEKHTHVSFKWTENGPQFTKVARSKRWEENQIASLKLLGLGQKLDDVFIVKDGSLAQTIHWIQENNEVLQAGGFELVNGTEQSFLFEKPTIHYTIGSQSDWFDLKIMVNVGKFQFPFSALLKNIKSGNAQYELPDKSIFVIPEEWFAIGASLDRATKNGEDFRVKKFQLDVLDHIQSQKIQEHLNQLVNIVPETPNKEFKGTLRPYQLDGLSWLMFLKNNHFGGILADDMGLGKTVQTLAFLQKITREKVVAVDLFSQSSGVPSLLVAPTSLVYNWFNEGKQFTPNLNLLIHSGSKRATTLTELQKVDVIITSYGLIRNDFSLFSQMHFNAIVLDESQNIKNRTAKTTQLIYKLQADIRLALTGTPVENSISDIWSQMNFLNKGMLGTAKQFEDLYVKPIEKQGDKEIAVKLQKLIKPFVLRRTKSEVAKDLPPIFEKVVLCEMSEDQEKLYEEVKSAYRNSILEIVKEKGLQKSKLNILQGLTKLRQIANHPAMLDKEYTGTSGKHEVLLEHIKTAVSEGHKVLVFSQFVSYLTILNKELNKSNIATYELVGSTSKENRQDRVEKFQSQNDVSVFLLSLKAGGTGLNLTAADYVFLVDPWWNPAAEAQARDRTHRIGQANKVFSYKFISKDTIEEKIVQLQRRKEGFAKDIITSENNILANLDLKDLGILFS